MGKILLCDDEESLCRSLSRILRSSGHEVVTASGPDGAARIREDRFDLILTDIRMPGVDGFEIIATARQHAPHTPVIAMSGSAEIPDAVKAMHAGARDFLIKPFDGKALDDVVAAVLRPHRNTPESRQSPRLARSQRAVVAGCRPRDGAGAGPAVPGGRHALYRADHRRIRDGQGAGRALAARGLVARGTSVRCREQRGHSAQPGRVRAVRSRARLLHGRDHLAPGKVRAGQRRHHLPGRDRRDGAGRAGQTAAADSGRRALSRRRGDAAQDRRAHPGGDQPQPRERRWPRGVSGPTCSGV